MVMESSIRYGGNSRNDLLAVVQNLNCIASPGKVLVVPLNSDTAIDSSKGSGVGIGSVASSDSRSVISIDANDDLLLEEEHIDLSPACSDASDDSSSSSCNYDDCSIEKLEFMASLSLLPKPLVKDLQEQNMLIKQHYGNWYERLHSKDFTAIQSEVYGAEYSHSAAELAHFSGYDQSSWQPHDPNDSRRNIVLATVCNQNQQQAVAIENITEQQHNSNLLQIAHQLQERHKALAEAKHQLESEEQLLKQNIQQLASCFTSPQLQ